MFSSIRLQAFIVLIVTFVVTQYANGLSFNDSDYWAVIGNAGNGEDNTGYGSVDYEYAISKYEVTNAQYAEFLNAVKADPNGSDGLYNANPVNSSYYGITYDSNSSSFTIKSHNLDQAQAGYKFYENKPVTYVSWYDALRFINWHNSGNTEYGAYDLSLQSTNPENIVRLSGAMYYLPSEDEWYKAAYYDPDLYGGQGGYWNFPTGRNSVPIAEDPDGGTNSANYNNVLTTDPKLTDVDAYSDSESPYGTLGQGGNVYEWNEAMLDDIYRGLRGGSWRNEGTMMAAYDRSVSSPTNEGWAFGFRVVSSLDNPVPEPTTILLLALSIVQLIRRRIK